MRSEIKTVVLVDEHVLGYKPYFMTVKESVISFYEVVQIDESYKGSKVYPTMGWVRFKRKDLYFGIEDTVTLSALVAVPVYDREMIEAVARKYKIELKYL